VEGDDAKRWELLKTMAGQGPLTIREVARRAARDVKAVHGDIRALLNAGVLDGRRRDRWCFRSTRCGWSLRYGQLNA